MLLRDKAACFLAPLPLLLFWYAHHFLWSATFSPWQLLPLFVFFTPPSWPPYIRWPLALLPLAFPPLSFISLAWPLLVVVRTGDVRLSKWLASLAIVAFCYSTSTLSLPFLSFQQALSLGLFAAAILYVSL